MLPNVTYRNKIINVSIPSDVPLGSPKHRWENNIKMDLQEVGCGGTDWIQLAQDRERWQALAKAVMKLPVP